MTAYSFKSYAMRDRDSSGQQVPLVTIQHGHKLNSEHRAPFYTGVTAARALLVHAGRELSHPERGPLYFQELREIHDRTTTSGQRLKDRLLQRQSRAASALANSDIELTSEQLQIVADIAIVQGKLGELLIPDVMGAGQSAEAVIDQIDHITRDALRAATFHRTQQQVGIEGDPTAWSRRLLDRLNKAPGADQDASAQQARTDLVNQFADLISALENALPLAVDRDEPLYEIDEALDPLTVAMTRDALSEQAARDFTPADIDEDSLTEEAKRAIWNSMSMEEREFAATKIALTPGQRIEVGMQVINSTPSLIRLPEIEVGQGRFDVRMATEEEARVMDALIRYAGEQRTYPGPERALEHIESMKELAMPTAVLGRETLGLAVANNPAAISHASTFLTKFANEAEVRFIVHADAPSVIEELKRVRAEALQAAGREVNFKDASDATREFGGWTLLDNGEDRFIGTGPADAAIFVANADAITVYSDTNDLEVTPYHVALDALAKANTRLKVAEHDLRVAQDAMEATRDPKLVALAAELEANGEDNSATLKAALESADPKLRRAYQERLEAHNIAKETLAQSQRTVDTIARQNAQEGIRTATPGAIARATIIDLAQQQGKLKRVYEPGNANEGAVIETRGGALSEVRTFVAQQKAQRLRNGDSVERGNLRRIFHSERGVNSILIDGSNYFREDKGAAKGMDAIRERIASLPNTSTLLTSNNPSNAISRTVVDTAKKTGRQVVLATAWRVTDTSKPITVDGRRINLSERKTELDLGTVGVKTDKGTDVRAREWVYRDLKNALVVVEGGGSMSRETYDAIKAHMIASGKVGHSLTQAEVDSAYRHLLANGKPHLEAPKFAGPQLARAIMQEALIDYANQAVIATDMGRDFHSATLIRLAVDADKLAVAYDKEGNAVPVNKAYEHNLQFAKSIADNTLDALNMNTRADREYGQLVLSSLPGIDSNMARAIGETYQTLGDVMRAAEKGEASPALPPSLHPELSRAGTWAAAFGRADEIAKVADVSRIDGIAATNPAYPKNLLEAGRSDMLYVTGTVDLNTPTMAIVIGSKSKVENADIDAAKTIAYEAKSKGWAVSLHANEASAPVAKALASLPENLRPSIVLIGDGHPGNAASPKLREAQFAVEQAGGGYITHTPPLAHADNNEKFISDPRRALDLQGRQSHGVVVLKSSANDVELLAVRAAMEAGRPVAAVGPSNPVTPTMEDLRFRGAEYTANKRLLTGGDRISVMLENRQLAFQPSFIPDMSEQTKARYIPFEGSTAGMMNAPGERPKNEIDHSKLETSGRVHAEIAWKEPAEFIPAGRGTAAFIEKIEAGQARQIVAKEADIARMARDNDLKFLDTAHLIDTRADILQVFKEVNEAAHDAIDAELLQQFHAQKAGLGR